MGAPVTSGYSAIQMIRLDDYVMSGEDPFDPRKLTFSQAHGYEELPRPLKLEELNKKARTKL